MPLSVYFLRPRKPCINRCGSPARKDFPNTPILKLTDSGQRQFLPLSHQRLLRAQRFGTTFQQRPDRMLDRSVESALLRDHVDQTPGERLSARRYSPPS